MLGVDSKGILEVEGSLVVEDSQGIPGVEGSRDILVGVGILGTLVEDILVEGMPVVGGTHIPEVALVV